MSDSAKKIHGIQSVKFTTYDYKHLLVGAFLLGDTLNTGT